MPSTDLVQALDLPELEPRALIESGAVELSGALVECDGDDPVRASQVAISESELRGVVLDAGIVPGLTLRDVILRDCGLSNVDGREGAIGRVEASGFFWVLGMGSRFAFIYWITHSGAATIASFSAAHSITSGEAWTVALLAMAVFEVGGRSLIQALRRTALQTAAALVVSNATVKTHINHVFAKIGARDRAQAVHYAYTHGLAG